MQAPAGFNYYERCLALVRAGGLIALDNMLWGGAVARLATDADTAALQALNAKLQRNRRIDHALLTVGDDMAVALDGVEPGESREGARRLFDPDVRPLDGVQSEAPIGLR